MNQRSIRIADLFCGAGGSSLGAKDACERLGYKPLILAVNHWDIAIATHSKNLPEAKHLCQSIDNIDPLKAVATALRGKLDVLWASPECTHFSQARGGKPLPDQRRSSAWKVVEWAAALMPATVLIENVQEFRTWGPLKKIRRMVLNKKTGKKTRKTMYVPIPGKKGTIYMAFLNALRSLGYNVEDRILCAADYGDATTRERLFIQCRLGKPVVWPEATHSKESEIDLFGNTLEPWRGAKEIINKNLPSRSIFDPKRKPLVITTYKRMFTGLDRFGPDWVKPFIIDLRRQLQIEAPESPLTAARKGKLSKNPKTPTVGVQVILRGKSTARSLQLPIPSIGTSGAHVGLAEPFISAYRGNHSGKADGANRNHSINEPLNTLDASNRYALVDPQPFVLGHRQFDEDCIDSISRPLRTVTAKGASDMGIVEAEASAIVNAGGPSWTGEKPHSLEDPLTTVLTREHKCLAQASLVPSDDVSFILKTTHTKSNGCHVRSIERPLGTITTARGGEDALVSADSSVLVPFFGERDGQQPRTHSIGEPLPTVTSHGAGGIAEACLVTVNHGVGKEGENGHGRRARSVDEPLPTATNKIGIGLAEPLIAKFYGTGQCRPISEPLDTVTTKDRFGLVQVSATTPGAISVKGKKSKYLRLQMPVINGIALDIKFRMLHPSELAGSHSFPENYQFEGTRDDVVKQIGNSNPRRLTAALCMAVLSA